MNGHQKREEKKPEAQTSRCAHMTSADRDKLESKSVTMSDRITPNY